MYVCVCVCLCVRHQTPKTITGARTVKFCTQVHLIPSYDVIYISSPHFQGQDHLEVKGQIFV